MSFYLDNREADWIRTLRRSRRKDTARFVIKKWFDLQKSSIVRRMKTIQQNTALLNSGGWLGELDPNPLGSA